jgi:hypothetical protein
MMVAVMRPPWPLHPLPVVLQSAPLLLPLHRHLHLRSARMPQRQNLAHRRTRERLAKACLERLRQHGSRFEAFGD